MAKAANGSVNMSEEARRWYREHPNDNPAQCVAGLADEGIRISTHVASNVKYKKVVKKKRSGPVAARPAARPSTAKTHRKKATTTHKHRSLGFAARLRSNAADFTISDLREMKDFAEAHGGIEQTTELLAGLESLRE